jgi:hypothetical protein
MIDCINKLKTNFEESANFLAKKLDRYPNLYKVTLVASHFFRAFMTYCMISASPLIGIGLAVPLSLVYRFSVERFCIFRFTLPSLIGGLALFILKSSAIAGAPLLILYTAVVFHICSEDINTYMKNLHAKKPKPCCKMGLLIY